MGKIVQIIDSLHDERLLFRICEVVGTYNNPFAPSSELIVGSNKFFCLGNLMSGFQHLRMLLT